jgi:C4-dicarboxylate transporter DctM subunit
VTSDRTWRGAAAALRFGRAADAALDGLCTLLLFAAAVIAAIQVVARYGLNAALPWPEEAALFAFVWAVFLGLGVAAGRDGHIAIQLFGQRLPRVARPWHTGFVRAMTAAAAAVMVVHGQDYAGRVLQASPAMQVPMRYLFMAVPAGGLLTLAYLLLRPAGPWWSGTVAVAAGLAAYWAVRHGGLPQLPGGAAPVLMVVALALVLLEVPVVFALAFGAFAAFAPRGEIMLVIVSQNMAAALNSFTLLAIPFFIMAAAVMNAGGITARLIALATHFVGHLRGGLGQANVVTNTLLAGVSGSSTADASAITKLMVPEMEKRGYDRAFGCALTAASATLANLIPPSLGLIIYAALASVSVGALFVATIVPGLMTAAALAAVVWIVSRRRGYGGDLPRSGAGVRLQALALALPALALPVVIVGGVRFGVFTATEAGAIALAVAVATGAAVYRRLTAAGFWAALREATSDTVAVAVIIAAAAPFAWVLTAEQVPQKVAAAIASAGGGPVVAVLLVLLLLLVVGLFMEMIAAMVILVPILVPVMRAAGVDAVQFGIVLVLALVIGALTPPLGVLVFTTARVGRVGVAPVFAAVIPFVGAMVLVLLAVAFVPALTLAPLRWLGP